MKTIDYSHEEFTSELLPSKPLASSTLQGWSNVYFQYHEEGALEIPDHAPLQDAFIVIHSPSNKIVKRTLDGKLNEEIDHAGDVIQAPAGYGHSVAWDSKAAFSIMAFEPGYLASMGYDLHNPNKFHIRPHFARRDPVIFGIAQSLKLLCDANRPISQMYLDSIGSFVASHLMAHYSEVENFGGLCHADLNKVIDYMHANLHLKIGLAELAKLLNMSQSYFSKLFKSSTGATPYQYLMQCRLRRAKELLKQTTLTADEIASRTGFDSKSHLSRTFTQHLSISPIKYRKLL
jgi:AraC family transcriptional regulator